jgi:hypothetical protein
VLPEVLKDDLIRHLSGIRSIYDKDRREEINGVWLPGALERKYPCERIIARRICNENTPAIARQIEEEGWRGRRNALASPPQKESLTFS